MTPPLLHRRALLKGGLAAAAGLALGPAARAADPPAPAARAKSMIQIWMWGGPAHLDTFDPKPDAGRDYCGPLNQPIETNVPGVRIGQLLPRLARHADKYSILRGMTHGSNAHETAAYVMQTGHPADDGTVHPSVGAVVSYFKGVRAGYKGLIPPYIVMTKPQGRFSEAGFLGSRYKPFATGGNPNLDPFLVEGVRAKGISSTRQQERRALLQRLDVLGAALPGNSEMERVQQCRDQAYDLILGDAGKVFDLAEEKDEVRQLYGRTTFGQSCLLARRLVERGVPYITINYSGWDTHKQHFQAMNRQLPDLDNGFASLLEDLSATGLLDQTLVWWGGEFGRSPKVQWEAPWNGGRSHYGKVFSAVLAGGGFKGGQVVGASDARGENVAERPVYPWDFTASLYDRLGIPGDAVLPHPQGRSVRVIPGPGEKLERGGVLREIMT